MVAKEKTQSPDSLIHNQQHFLGSLDSGALSTVSHNINDNNKRQSKHHKSNEKNNRKRKGEVASDNVVLSVVSL